MASQAPTKLLILVVISMAFQSMMYGEELVNGAGLSGTIEAPSEDDFGVSGLGDALGFVVQVLTLIVKIPALIFDLAFWNAVTGLPDVIRVPIGLFNSLVLGSWAFRLITDAGALIPFT